MSNKTSKKMFGGEVASRESSENHSKEIDLSGFVRKVAPIYVKYSDHVLFKNCNPAEVKPCVREVIGWLVSESPEALLICIDQPVDPLVHEEIAATGLAILKDCILETHKVRIKKPFNCSRVGYSGHMKPYRMEK
jgi:hypothetical protein